LPSTKTTTPIITSTDNRLKDEENKKDEDLMLVLYIGVPILVVINLAAIIGFILESNKIKKMPPRKYKSEDIPLGSVRDSRSTSYATTVSERSLTNPRGNRVQENINRFEKNGVVIRPAANLQQQMNQKSSDESSFDTLDSD
jgi:hypothetical protein